MPQHRLVDTLRTRATEALAAWHERDVLVAVLTAAVAFLFYLPARAHDHVAVMTPGLDPVSFATDTEVARNLPIVEETLIDRWRRLQLRDVADTLTEPGRVVGGLVPGLFPHGVTARPQQFAAAFFGAVTVAVLVGIMRRLQVVRIAAVASGLAFAFQQHIWLQAVVPGTRMGAIPLLALSLLVLLLWSEARKPALLWIGIGCWLLSSAAQPWLLCTAPAVAWFTCSASLNEFRRILLRPTARGAVVRVGVLCGAAAVGLVAGTGSFDPVRAYDLLSSEFGLLGFLFLAMGLVHHLLLRPTRQILLLSLSLAGVVGWLTVSAVDDARELPVVLLLASPIVGHGMSIIARSRADRVHAVAATAVLLAFPALTAVSHRNAVDDARGDYTRSFLYARGLAAVLPDGGTVAAFPDTRGPLSLAWAFSESARLPVVELPWDVRRIRETTANRPTFVLEPTRTALELLGFRFDRPRPIRMGIPLDVYLERLTPGRIVAAVAGRETVGRADRSLNDAVRFIGGELEPPVGGDRFHGFAGIARGAGIAQLSDPLGVDLLLQAGEVLDDRGTLLPVNLRLLSGRGTTRIEVDGRSILTNPNGVGIAVLGPGGAVEKVAVAVARDDRLWIPVEAARHHVARLIGWEPCMSVGTEGWVDVSTILTGDRAGVLFPSRLPGNSLALYVWKEDRRLLLRRNESSAARPGFTFETFDRALSAEHTALDRLIAFDGLAPAHPIRRQRFVQLLHVDAQESGTPFTAIGFNGADASGMARLLGPAGEERVIICGTG